MDEPIADRGEGDFLLEKIRLKRSSDFFFVDGCLSNDAFIAVLDEINICETNEYANMCI